MSKITERAVFDQLYAHVMNNELFPELQSAYRKSRSTETALVILLNSIYSLLSVYSLTNRGKNCSEFRNASLNYTSLLSGAISMYIFKDSGAFEYMKIKKTLQYNLHIELKSAMI